MGLHIADSSLQETAFIVAVVGVSLAILATILRFVATRLARRKPSWEDWCAVLATFFYIAYVVPFLYLIVTFNGRTLKEVPRNDFVRMSKAGYVMAAQFCMQQMFAKLSLCFLYYRLFYVSQAFVYCLYFLGTAQVLWSIATYLVHWFECIPVAHLWNPQIKGSCVNPFAFLTGGETPNSLIDFALIGLAIWMLQSLHIRTLVKLKVSILFAVGGLAGVLGFVKIGQGYAPMHAKVPLATEKVILLSPIWATVQQACSCICCCAPIYKPLVPQLGLLSKLRSFSNRTFGGSAKISGQDETLEKEASVRKVSREPKHWFELNERPSQGSSQGSSHDVSSTQTVAERSDSQDVSSTQTAAERRESA